MGLKVDGGVSKVKPIETTPVKLEIKLFKVNNSSPISNSAVLAKQNVANFQANMRQIGLLALATAASLKTSSTPPTPKLTGNPEQDIKTVAKDLKNLPPDQRDDYLMEVLKYGDYGKQVLQRSGSLTDPADREALASAINEAYKQNPAEMSKQLNAITDMEKNYPYYEWTGLADVIRSTGNDSLIADYAKHAMDIAAKDPKEKGAWSVDALTALGGMSPEGLQNFINFGSAKAPTHFSPSTIGRFIDENKAAFNKMLTTSAGFLGGPANNVGFANAWAFNPAMGDLLKVASKMTDSKGNLTSDALNIFKTVAPLSGDNFFTKEALGKMFIEHAQQITDTFALKRNADGTTNRNFDPNVMKDFFINVVYSPISDLLKYNGKSMVETIMGDGKGNKGVIGKIAQNIMDKAAKPNADVTYLGQEIGYLFGAVSGGFLDSVQAYKDKFKDDKEFREFLYGAVNKGIGSLAEKVGLPLDKVGEFVEKMIEAGKEKDKTKQLKKFQEAFLGLKNQMSQTLLDFQRTHPNAEGLETNFTIAWNDFITSYLASDWIVK